MEKIKAPSRSFCILPWVHILGGPDGTCRVCCHSVAAKEFSDDAGERMFLYRHRIEDIWNCKSLRDIRMKMLRGEPVGDCEICNLLEERTGTSPRHYNLNDFSFEYLRLEKAGEFKKTLSNGGRSVFNPVYFGVALNRNCNLSCRMCAPLAGISREVVQGNGGKIEVHKQARIDLINELEEVGRNDSSGESDCRLNGDNPDSWDFIDTDMYWQQIEKCIPHLDVLIVHGGEPLLRPGRINALIDKIIALQRQNYISFLIVTNLTMLDEKLFGRMAGIDWQRFQVIFSIDGFGPLQEYIRYPLKWKKFDDNLRRLCRLSDRIDLCASVTVQAYNVFHLTEILKYLDSFEDCISVAFNFLMLPEYLKIDVVPTDIKRQAIGRLRNYVKNRAEGERGEVSPRLLDSINMVIEELNREDGSIPERREQFIQYTREQDRKRGQLIMDGCPELKSLFS